MGGKGSGYFGHSREHGLHRKGIPTTSKGKIKNKRKPKDCDVPNPMNTRSNEELLQGHFLTHTENYQSSVGVENAECEHDRVAEVMSKRGFGLNKRGKHRSPFKILI